MYLMLLAVVTTRLNNDWQHWHQCQHLHCMILCDDKTDNVVHQAGSRLRGLLHHLLQMHHYDTLVTNLLCTGQRWLYRAVLKQLPSLVTCQLTDAVLGWAVTPDEPTVLQLGIEIEMQQQGVHVLRMSRWRVIVNHCSQELQDLLEIVRTIFEIVRLVLDVTQTGRAQLVECKLILFWHFDLYDVCDLFNIKHKFTLFC